MGTRGCGRVWHGRIPLGLNRLSRGTGRAIEVRRHSVRDPGEEGLSEAGRRLAGWVGRTSGPFDWVVSSPRRRAVETALGVARAPDETREIWAELGAEVSEAIDWPAPFERYRRAVREAPAVRRKAEELTAETDRILKRLPDEGIALVVTHGGFPELLTAAHLPGRSLPTPEGPVRCLDGVRIRFGHATGPKVEILRVPETMTRL
ncbi:MAG TPA: histidine phosphatase family protein [Thermoplasmata archaeon]|nr:histidine phosphatase family protein [Thermoplasmata archaeon]